ncbi:kinase domain-containing protein [Phialemonium atrogriseum]|uniref:Kinase domain-containing protein n=1 Tax=Phialemonium atrogriseum TaxID=1093897 RepID=A0AAJ0FGG6_9PEZI|nr:kinase domain-containing protein [Phialemonium atrogriseum]KAK1762328.1 kinase domain-containing protein [Phialemonium atrogriseum]
MPADFEKQEYWHTRFATETSFEWLVTSEVFMSILDPYLSRLSASSRILHIGFGTSGLQNLFRKRGFLDVTNVDFEPLAIQRGMQLEKATFGDVKMKYVVADATKLDMHEAFDVVIDKSTVDAIACGGDEALLRMARGVRKCLTEGGFWISLSFSSSRFDMEGLPLDVDVIAKVPTPKYHPNDPDVYHFCYLLRPKIG